MIQLKNSQQIKEMREAGRITGEALLIAREHVREGISTYELDKLIREHIERSGAKPSFLGYGGFPASACISMNDEVIHGIPSEKKILKEGDIVKIDVGAFYKGFHGDSARTYAVGKVSAEAEKLIIATKESFYKGAEKAVIGNRVGDISSAIEQHILKKRFSGVRSYVGHGVGHDLHEDPEVPNYGIDGRGARLSAGMTLAIEPMVNVGTHMVRVLGDKWTVVTADGKLSAHYENTVAITENGPLMLTEI